MLFFQTGTSGMFAMGVWGGEAHWHLFVFKFPSLILQIILIYKDNSKKSSAIPPNHNVSKKNILLLPFVLKKHNSNISSN